MSTTPNEIYPFSTPDGKAIPLDILKPSYLGIYAFPADASVSFTLPEESQVAMFISTVPAIVSFSAALDAFSSGQLLANTLIIPEKSIVASSILNPTFHVRGIAEAGTLYIQIIEKWAGLALIKQYSRK